MTTVLDEFKEFVTHIQAAAYYSKWSNQNPGELSRWKSFRDAVLAGQSPAKPVMNTQFGMALVIAGMEYLLSEKPVIPPKTESNSLKTGDTISGKYNWTVVTSGDCVKLEYWLTDKNGNHQLVILPNDGTNKFIFSFDTTKWANGIYKFGIVEIDSLENRYLDDNRADASIKNVIITPGGGGGSLKTYETLGSFVDVQAKPGDLQLVDAPGLPGKKAWQVRTSPTSTILDAEQRCHALDSSDVMIGDTITIGCAVLWPVDRPVGRGWDAGFMELHQPWHGPVLSNQSPAPGYGYVTDDQLAIVVRGGNKTQVKTAAQGNGSFVQHQWGAIGNNGYVGDFANGISHNLPDYKGKWTLLLIETFLDTDAGWVEVEINDVIAVPKFTCPTCYPVEVLHKPDGSIDGFFPIPVNGYRMGSNPAVNQNTAIHYMWTARGDRADVKQYLHSYLGI